MFLFAKAGESLRFPCLCAVLMTESNKILRGICQKFLVMPDNVVVAAEGFIFNRMRTDPSFCEVSLHQAFRQYRDSDSGGDRLD